MAKNQPVNKGLILALLVVVVIGAGYLFIKMKGGSGAGDEDVKNLPKPPAGLTPVSPEEMKTGPQPSGLR